MTRLLPSKDWMDIAWVAVAALVAAMVASNIFLEIGDVEDKWYVAKAWAGLDFPAFYVNHHNLRWGITIPASIWVAVFGDSPLSCMMLNDVVFAAATAIVFYLLREVSNFWIAVIGILAWLCNPSSYFMPVNLMPEVYSIFYVCLALAFLLASMRRNSLVLYGVAVALLFVAYGAKETNAFVYPGLGLFELWRRRYDRLLVLILVSAVLLIAETAVIDTVLSGMHLVFGRLEAILAGDHIKGMMTHWGPYEPIDLIRRWGFLNETEYVSKVIYILFALVSVYVLIAARRYPSAASQPGASQSALIDERELVLAVVCMGLSFAFFTTFFVVSIDPFVLGQTLSDRYLWLLLPFAFIAFASVAASLWGPAVARWRAVAHHRGLTRLFMVDPDSMSASCLGKAIAFALVIVIASFARWSLDYSIVKVARYGVAQPYSVLNVDDYFERLIRDRLEEGCTLVFASSRAAWSALVYAFPFGYFDDPVRFYARSLDGLRTRDGAVVVTYSVPAEDAGQISPSLPDSLHIKRGQHGPAVNLNVVRFDYGDGGRACNEIYYLGHVDIPEREQRL